MMFVPKLWPASDDTPVEAPPQREPVIGLALGAGAARGWAHLGILRKLDEAGIRPRVVVGTSIGAVVGGCWASGKMGELEVFARSLTKRGMLSMMDLSLLGGSGLLSGDRMRKQLEEHFKGQLIEELPVRFASVATEIRTGHEIWLTRGEITRAMRASYALPGIFVPVQVGGRWLIDGALTNPVPVSVARALGAEMIIAVNLHTDVLGRSGVIHDHGADALPVAPSPEQDALRQSLFSVVSNRIRHPFGNTQPAPPVDKSNPAPGLLSVMLDAFNISQDRIARARLAGDPPDVTVNPKLGGIGLSEFHRAEEAIAAGEAAITKVMDEILDIRKAMSLRVKTVS